MLLSECNRCVHRLFFVQEEDGIREAQESRGLGDVYKRQGVRIEREMEIALLIGLLVARLVFVVQYRSAYAAQPWLSLIHI